MLGQSTVSVTASEVADAAKRVIRDIKTQRQNDKIAAIQKMRRPRLFGLIAGLSETEALQRYTHSDSYMAARIRGGWHLDRCETLLRMAQHNHKAAIMQIPVDDFRVLEL